MLLCARRCRTVRPFVVIQYHPRTLGELTQSGLMVYGFCSVGPSMAAMTFNLVSRYRLNTLKVV